MTIKVQIDDEVRDATEEEIAAIRLRKTQDEATKAALDAAAEAKAAAQAKLAALGLTADDLKALGL